MVKILEIIMPRNRFSRNIAIGQRLAVESRNDADGIVVNRSHWHNRNIKKMRIQTVRSRRDEGRLTAFLPIILQKSLGILKVIARYSTR